VSYRTGSGPLWNPRQIFHSLQVPDEHLDAGIIRCGHAASIISHTFCIYIQFNTSEYVSFRAGQPYHRSDVSVQSNVVVSMTIISSVR
jgi:hypothetical protein